MPDQHGHRYNSDLNNDEKVLMLQMYQVVEGCAERMESIQSLTLMINHVEHHKAKQLARQLRNLASRMLSHATTNGVPGL